MEKETRIRRIKGIETFPKTLEDYHAFSAEHPEIQITRKQHTEIIREGLKLIQGYILDDTTGFKLPHSMGYLAMTKFKPKKPRKDHCNSNKYQKDIPYLNLHSFGFIAYVRWFKPHRNFANKRLYSFDGCREIDRHIKTNMKAGKVYEILNKDFYYALVQEVLPEWRLDKQRKKLQERIDKRHAHNAQKRENAKK